MPSRLPPCLDDGCRVLVDAFVSVALERSLIRRRPGGAERPKAASEGVRHIDRVVGEGGRAAEVHIGFTRKDRARLERDRGGVRLIGAVRQGGAVGASESVVLSERDREAGEDSANHDRVGRNARDLIGNARDDGVEVTRVGDGDGAADRPGAVDTRALVTATVYCDVPESPVNMFHVAGVTLLSIVQSKVRVKVVSAVFSTVTNG